MTYNLFERLVRNEVTYAKRVAAQVVSALRHAEDAGHRPRLVVTPGVWSVLQGVIEIRGEKNLLEGYEVSVDNVISRRGWEVRGG